MRLETVCRLGGVKTPISHLNVKGMVEDIPYLTNQGVNCVRNL